MRVCKGLQSHINVVIKFAGSTTLKVLSSVRGQIRILPAIALFREVATVTEAVGYLGLSRYRDRFCMVSQLTHRLRFCCRAAGLL
jgi:hypothetical protein